MQKYKFVFSDDAKEDLDRIYFYIFESSHSEKYANTAIEEITKAVTYLEEHPRFYPSLGIQEFRKCVVKNYIVIYRVDDENREVFITRIFGGAQDYEKFF